MKLNFLICTGAENREREKDGGDLLIKQNKKSTPDLENLRMIMMEDLANTSQPRHYNRVLGFQKRKYFSSKAEN